MHQTICSGNFWLTLHCWLIVDFSIFPSKKAHYHYATKVNCFASWKNLLFRGSFIFFMLFPSRLHISSCHGQCWLLLLIKNFFSYYQTHSSRLFVCPQVVCLFWLHLVVRSPMQLLSCKPQIDCCFYLPQWSPLEMKSQRFPNATMTISHGMSRYWIFTYLWCKNIVENAAASVMCTARCCHCCMLIFADFTFLDGALCKHHSMEPFLTIVASWCTCRVFLAMSNVQCDNDATLCKLKCLFAKLPPQVKCF